MNEMNEILLNWLIDNKEDTKKLCEELWNNPELPMKEFHACNLISDYMIKQGFNVKTYHCKDKMQKPNTVIATFGNGKPVIGIIGEYDALAGLGQNISPYQSSIPGAGHGCGHCLTSPACCSAAVAVKKAMEDEKLNGTIKFMACPAEESGEGKVYMMQRGEFNDLDCCISWHPMNYNLTTTEGSLLALCNLNIEYYGKSAHAAAMPEMGRSALDAAELTNVGVQYLREHVTDDVRIHYVYTNGGDAANVVPKYASLHYIIRARTLKSLTDVIERVKNVARGAALMTETEVKFTITSISSETFIVHSFNDFCYKSLLKIPKPDYSDDEYAFAKELYKNVMQKDAPDDVIPVGIDKPTGITTFVPASTDVGYLTHEVPTCRLFGWGMLQGVPVHHWGITATVGSSIGHKSATYGGLAVAQCVYDILNNPDKIQTWKDELNELKKNETDFQPIFPDNKEVR